MSLALVYLHGVGHREDDRNWHKTLSRRISLQGLAVHTPWYADLLRPEATPPPVSLPPVAGRGAGPAYHESRLAVRARFGRQRWHGPFSLVPSPVIRVAVALAARRDADFAQARRYVREPDLRSAVTARVLAGLPESGELLLLGHSLGSLVAVDLLAHLPPRLTVRRLITTGSPAGIRGFHVTSDRLERPFPYAAVDSWVNVASRLDPIVAGRGLEPLFPAATDIWVTLPGRWAHDENDYYRDGVLVQLVGSTLDPVPAG